MKIATWNLNRPRQASARNSEIREKLREVNADVLILTETNSVIDPGAEYHNISTTAAIQQDGTKYHTGEFRTTVWSKFPITHSIKTCEPDTSVCGRVSTKFGALYVYGTVIGVFGNRHPSFLVDLEKQISDWKNIAKTTKLCVVGDFNLSFKDPYYYTKTGRQLIADCFAELRLTILTRDIDNNVDHIAISESLLKGLKPEKGVWNEDKKLSDHKGVWVSL